VCSSDLVAIVGRVPGRTAEVGSESGDVRDAPSRLHRPHRRAERVQLHHGPGCGEPFTRPGSWRQPRHPGSAHRMPGHRQPAGTCHRDPLARPGGLDRKSTRLNSSHVKISYAVFCLKKKKKNYSVASLIMVTTL